jgi:hypothetical protein
MKLAALLLFSSALLSAHDSWWFWHYHPGKPTRSFDRPTKSPPVKMAEPVALTEVAFTGAAVLALVMLRKKT